MTTGNEGTVTLTTGNPDTVTVTTSPSSTTPLESKQTPNCPNEPSGRIYDSTFGGQFEIYCNTDLYDTDAATLDQPTFADCIRACEIFNIDYFYDDSKTCRGVTYWYNQTSPNCLLKNTANVFPNETRLGVDSAALLNPFKGSTDLFPHSTTNALPTNQPTETPVTCPDDYGNVLITEADQDAYVIDCNYCGNGTDMPGSPFFVASYRACIDVCDQTPGCLEAQYFPTDRQNNACLLKSSFGPGATDTTCEGARRLDGPACPRDDGKIYVNGNQTFVIECYVDHVDCDFQGMPLYTDSFGECMDICHANAGSCYDVSWIPGVPQGPCFLKACVGSRVPNQQHVWGGRLLFSGNGNYPPPGQPATETATVTSVSQQGTLTVTVTVTAKPTSR